MRLIDEAVTRCYILGSLEGSMLISLKPLKKALVLALLLCPFCQIFAADCRPEIEAFSAVSKAYGRQQEKIFTLLKERLFFKKDELHKFKIDSAQDISTDSLHKLILEHTTAGGDIHLLYENTTLVKISLELVEYRSQIEMCFGKIQRAESVKSHMNGYQEGSDVIKRAYGLDKLKFSKD